MEGIAHRPECPNPDAPQTVHLMSRRYWEGWHYAVELHRCEHCGRSAIIERRLPLEEPK